MPESENRLSAGMQTSPWIILGSTVILLVVVAVLAFQNTHRERRYMSQLLSAKGVALIRAVEAGARTGMMGMRWGGRQIQRLLEETAQLPDVSYMAVIDQNGQSVAHSDASKIDQPFDPERKDIHSRPDEHAEWELVTQPDGKRIFEVRRPFQPISPKNRHRFGRMQRMMPGHGMTGSDSDDWFSPGKQEELLIVVGLDITPFEEAIRSDIQTTVILSVLMILLGFGGFVSLFWMHSYRVAKQSLQDTSRFAGEVVSHLPVGLIATDSSGRVTFFNSAAEKITSVNRSIIHRQKPESLLPQSLCGLQEELNRQDVIAEREMECRFDSEETVPISVSAASIANDQGQFLGQVLILRDLSEIRRLQSEVRRQEKLAAMGGLAAGVAHEVRNPLSSIKALATFFAGQFDEGSESNMAAKVMVQEVDRLNRVITELLEFSRPTDLKRAATDMEGLISRSIQLIQQDAANKHIEVSVEMADNLGPVWIDPDRMTQCLLNLCLNAIQAMEEGGTLTILGKTGENEDFHLVVKDTGVGIPSGEIGKIFDPYYTTKSKGTGLGLAIVHKIIEAHGGKIAVASQIKKGTSVTLTLPCENETTVEEEGENVQKYKNIDRG